MNGSARWAFALVAALSILSLSAYGQQRPQIEVQTPETDGDQKVPIDSFELETGYVFQSDLNHGGSHGAQDEVENSISYSHRFQITGNWYFRGGLAYQRFDFGNQLAATIVRATRLAVVGLAVAGHLTLAAFRDGRPDVRSFEICG